MKVQACLSDLCFDRLLARDVPLPEAARQRAHIEQCARCSARLERLAAAHSEFSRSGPSLELPSEHGMRRAEPSSAPNTGAVASERRRPDRAAAPARPRLAARALAVGMTLAAALGGVFALREGERPSGSGTRAKGPSDPFELYIRHGQDLRRAADREAVYAGDQLQFAYSSATPGHVAVLSRDGVGSVSLYFPSGAAPSSSMARGAAWSAPAARGELLPESTILDEALGRERVYALFCDGPLDLAPLLRALETQGWLDPPSGCRSRTFELEKLRSGELGAERQDARGAP